ncbi:MAG TPA: ABC transporter substrate-binding protein [Thermoanaerobaculia bacterium]|nr:ABC transporter substrate-binding protein [Thermoanaerobaculia bacterium]
MSRRFLWSLAAALALAGCERPPAVRSLPERLVIALESAPTHLDPRVALDQAADRLFDLSMCGLLIKTPDGELEPDAAASWEILEGGRRYRFHLRTDVRFHDGRILGPEDVIDTLTSLVDGRVVTAKRGAFAELERVESPAPGVVDLVLSRPSGAFAIELTPALGILPRGTTPAQTNDHPVGCGSYRIVERSPERLLLEAFDGGHRPAPKIRRVELKVVPDATVRALELLKGTVHLVINDLPPDLVPRFQADPRFRVAADPGGNYAYLGLNLEDPALSDLRVRRALALAIDRDRLVATLWRGLGVVTETMMPPGSWARHEGLPRVPYDPEAAARLLEAAGYPDPDGPGPRPRLTLTFKTSTSEINVLQAQVIQQMAAPAGFALVVRSHEFATFYSDISRGNFQLFSLVRTAIHDPNIYRLILHSDSIPPRGQNRGRYRNPELDRRIDLGASLPERAARRPLYLEVQEILAHDLPYVSLFTKHNFAVMDARLSGFRNYPAGELLGVRFLSWEKGAEQVSFSQPSTISR